MSDKLRCPDAFRKAYHETDSCALDDGRICLLESGTECEIYQKYLAKEGEENVFH